MWDNTNIKTDPQMDRALDNKVNNELNNPKKEASNQTYGKWTFVTNSWVQYDRNLKGKTDWYSNEGKRKKKDGNKDIHSMGIAYMLPLVTNTTKLNQ